MIGTYSNLSSLSALFATSAEGHKNPYFAEFLEKETLWKFALESSSSDFELSDIVTAQIQHNDMNRAERTLFLMNPKNPMFNKHLAEIITANAQQGDIATAEKQLSLLESNLDSVLDKVELIQALTAISKAKAKINRINEAKEGFSTAKNNAAILNVFPNQIPVKSLTTIALAETESGNTEEAEKTFAAAEKVASQIIIYGVKVLSLIHIAGILIQAGNKEKAKKNLLLARDIIPQIEVKIAEAGFLKAIAKMQAEVDDVSSAKETVDMIENLEHKSLALKQLALTQLKGNNEGAKTTLILARDTARQIDDIDLQFDALLEIATAQVTASDVDEAKNTITLAHQVISKGREQKALLSIARIHAAIGDMKEVEKLFSTVMEQGISINNSVTPMTLMQIARVQCEIGDTLGAKKKLLMMMDQVLSEDAHIMPNILQKLAIVQATMGDIEEARKNLLSAKEMLLLLPEEKIKTTFLGLEEIAEIQAKIGDIQKAKEALSDIYKKQLALVERPNNALSAALKVLATLYIHN